jgi:hypothetical protein
VDSNSKQEAEVSGEEPSMNKSDIDKESKVDSEPGGATARYVHNDWFEKYLGTGGTSGPIDVTK